MGFLNQNYNNEKEMSGGLMFGYALVGFIAVIIVIFGIFIAVKFFKGDIHSDSTDKTPSTVEITDDENKDTEDKITSQDTEVDNEAKEKEEQQEEKKKAEEEQEDISGVTSHTDESLQ